MNEMRRNSTLLIAAITFLMIMMFTNKTSAQNEKGFILEHENQIAKTEPAPRNGKGVTTAYSFFINDTRSHLTFRKRVLHPGSDIGYHLQNEEEIYYIVSGEGDMKVNDSTFAVKAGDALLTLPGNSHGLKQKGKNDLVVIINYTKQ